MALIPENKKVIRKNDSAFKVLLYGDTGIGKTHFASKWPDPLIISTDGNYVYTDLPAIPISNWIAERKDFKSDKEFEEAAKSSFVNVVEELVSKKGAGFKTIIVDLIDDIHDRARDYILGEYDSVHESEIGSHGKGWDLVRTTLISKVRLIYSLPVNVILISHEAIKKRKNRIGLEYDYVMPNLHEKLARKLSGMGYALRAYWGEPISGTNAGKEVRLLSMSSKSDSFGVVRFSNAEGTPIVVDDIELDYDILTETLRDIKDPSKVDSFREDTKTIETESKKSALKKIAKKNKPIKVEEEAEEEEDIDTPEVETEYSDKEEEVIVEKPIIEKQNEESVDEQSDEEEPETKISTSAKDKLARFKKKKESSAVSDMSDEKREALNRIREKYNKK